MKYMSECRRRVQHRLQPHFRFYSLITELMKQQQAYYPSRRRILVLAVSAAAFQPLMPLLPVTARADVPQNKHFTVLLDGSPIGEHRIVFREDGNLLVVETQINIEVVKLTFTVFRFKHEAKETWDSGRLVSVESKTDNDGTLSNVTGSTVSDGFRLVSEKGPFLATKAIMSSNAIWDSRIVSAKRLIDVQHGSEIGLIAKRLPDEQVDSPSGSVRASRYLLITPFFTGKVFYDSNLRWVKAQVEVNGQTIEYALAR